jgi:hypothetical protein
MVYGGGLSRYNHKSSPEYKERHRKYVYEFYHNMTQEQKKERVAYEKLRRRMQIQCIQSGELPDDIMCAFMTGKTSEERGKTECDE